LRLGRVSLLLVVAALVFPATSHAAVTIGAPDVDVPLDGATDCPGPCTWVTASDPAATYAAPFDGVIVRWRVRAGGGTVNLRILQGVPPAPVLPRYLLKAAGPPIDRSSFFSTDPAVTQDLRVPIEQGDLIAVSQGIGQIASDAIAGTSTAHGIQGQVVDGSYDFGETYGPQRLLYNADIEPDADRDGYGDETQDLCPTDASVSGTCPIVTPPEPAALKAIRSASGGKRLVVDVDCPEARTTPCRGIVSARSTRKVRLRPRRGRRLRLSFGRKSYSVPPGQTEVLRFRISRAERKVLVRLRKLGVTMTLDAADADPVRFRGTAKAPKRKRR
jgi:hypothetical protein